MHAGIGLQSRRYLVFGEGVDWAEFVGMTVVVVATFSASGL